MRISILVVLSVFLIVGCNQKALKEKKPATTTDSIQMITDQIKQDSSDYLLFLQRARLNIELGKIDPAFRDVNKALNLNAQSFETFIMLSDLYFILGNIDNAVAALKKAAALDPQSEVPYVKLAETYLILKNYTLALKNADRAISLNANNNQAYFLKGIAFMEQGDTVQAVINLRISVTLDTTKYPAYMQLASIFQQQKDSVAIEYYQDALTAKPQDEKALFGLARFYQDLDRLDEAMEYYRMVNKLYPENKEAWYNEGYIYLVEKQDYSQAINAFQQAINIDSSYVEAVYNLGRTYEAQGKYDEAATQYRQALDIRTNYPLAIEGLNRMQK